MNRVTVSHRDAPVQAFSLDDAEMKSLVRELHRPDPKLYWSDLLLTSATGWIAFALAVNSRPLSPVMFISAILGVCALYRGLCFMHEITHQSPRALAGFETAWNCLIGFPLLMPTFVYMGVHQSHHRIGTYGTDQDPEYMPFARSRRMTTVFALESFFIPLGLIARFLFLAPLGLLLPRLHRWLVVYASALTMNLKYRRQATPELLDLVRRDSVILLLFWGTFAGLAIEHVIPLRTFAIWLAVLSMISFVNTLRTLGAHEYESDGEPLDRMGQLLDSIDTPGAFWTELWAPVGLRYHALHHYFPGIPYHNLRRAYRRIMAHLPVADAYKRMSSPSLQHSLQKLYRKGSG
ncbi:MAG: fatty acid desaturase [Acidobacteriota bacterium]|nr:fatty acid desaturase [Acidobacteriota bacterium]